MVFFQKHLTQFIIQNEEFESKDWIMKLRNTNTFCQ
jgi:hypothetical protein